jgi:hypothetical protein
MAFRLLPKHGYNSWLKPTAMKENEQALKAKSPTFCGAFYQPLT